MTGDGSWRGIPMLRPISWIVVLWQFLVLLYLVSDFSLTVMVQCFPDDEIKTVLFDYFDPIMVALLALDIIVTFNIMAINNGQIISKRSQVAVYYFSSVYFWVDSLSFLISIMEVVLNDRDNFTPSYNFIVFIKVIKAYEFNRNIKRYGIKSFNLLLLYELVKNIIILALINHVIGSFAFYLDYRLIQANRYPDDNPGAYWLLSSYSYPDIYSQDFWVRYSYSFYFSAVLISGIAYGDLVPQNPIQTAYAIGILFLPLVIYAYFFNAVYSVIAKKREKSKHIRKFLFEAKQYLGKMQAGEHLQGQIITYLTYYLRKAVLSGDFVAQLAPSARKAYITRNIHSKFDFNIFQQLLITSPLTDRVAFRDQLMAVIMEESFPERYKLILPDRIKLYYLNEGLCKRVTHTLIKYSDDISRHHYAGYYNFLTGVTSPKLKYESASFVTALSIERKAFLQLLNHTAFYELKEAFHLLREEKVLYENPTVNGETCFFCRDPGHYLDNCPALRPKIQAFKGYSSYHDRQKYSRKGFRMKREIGGGFCLWKEKREEGGKAEVGIQCETVEGNHGRSFMFQMIRQARVYYKEYNLSESEN